MSKKELIAHIRKLREMILDSDFIPDEEKAARIDGLDDLQETIAYQRKAV